MFANGREVAKVWTERAIFVSSIMRDSSGRQDGVWIFKGSAVREFASVSGYSVCGASDWAVAIQEAGGVAKTVLCVWRGFGRDEAWADVYAAFFSDFRFSGGQ